MIKENSNEAFRTLGPNTVISAVESLGYVCDGYIFALNSYENRVYQIGMPDGAPVVAKFYRPQRWTDAQIQEEHDFAAELLALEIPVAAPWRNADGASLHQFAGFGFAIFPWVAGRQPDLDYKDNLQVMGRYLGRVHLAGAARKFSQRGELSVANMAIAPRQYLLQENFIPAELGPAYETVTTQLIDQVEKVMSRLPRSACQRIHGDCHMGNVLWRDDIPHFVDFDDTVTGPVIQDIWMLLSGERDQRQAQLLEVVEGYEEFKDFPASQLELIEPLRTLRLIHYAAWLGKRWQDPAFPRSFPWFNTARYWSEHVLELREQLAALNEEPLRIY